MEENNSKVLYVLIVDDEGFIRKLIREALQGLFSIKTLEAADGLEALRILSDHGNDICVVVTDHNMSGMTGDELIAKAREKFPRIKFLLVSGGLTYKDVSEMSGPSKPNTFLAKPFSLRVVNKLVCDLIDEFVDENNLK